MTTSGHENSERDRWTTIGHNDPLESKLKWLPRTTAATAVIGHASAVSEGPLAVRKTATGHPETTRANAMKTRAVRRPPTIAQLPHKANQQTRRSTHTPSRPLTAHGKRSDSVSNKTAHESQSTKSGLKHPPGFPSLRSEGQGGP